MQVYVSLLLVTIHIDQIHQCKFICANIRSIGLQDRSKVMNAPHKTDSEKQEEIRIYIYIYIYKVDMDFYGYFIMLMYMYMLDALIFIHHIVHTSRTLYTYANNSGQLCISHTFASNHEQSATPYVAILPLECVIHFKHVHKNTHHCSDALSMEPLSHPDLTSGGGI